MNWLGFACAVLCLQLASCYIPAVPTNDTNLVSLSNDFIQLSWQVGSSGSQGVFRDKVSRQLIANGSVQVGNNYAARGALVHFTENNATQDASLPPWIAFVNCDTNSTNASQEIDIFTEVRDHGAVAALLYSLTAAACQMNQEYIDNFEKVIDVYSTTNLQSARLIDSQFNNVGANAYWYDSNALNASYSTIWSQLNETLSILSSATPSGDQPTASNDIATSFEVPAATLAAPTESDSVTSSDPYPNYFSQRKFRRQASPTLQSSSKTASQSNPAQTSLPAYLIAVLANVDAVFATNNSSDPTSSDSDPNNVAVTSSLAMIVLYVITAIVASMFLVVILSGTIRAIRNPERYGPRARMGSRPAQTRARGITKAILDTFPVVKFGRSESDPNEATSEAKENQIQMRDMEAAQIGDGGAPPPVTPLTRAPMSTENPAANPASPTIAAKQTIDPLEVDDSATCPICVEDFTAGDDLRVLPCDQRHRFHRGCIDEWLLGVSSLCPLCRLDLAQNGEESSSDLESETDHAREHSNDSWFRYPARAMQRRRRHLSAASNNSRPDIEAPDQVVPGPEGSFNQSRFRRYLLQVRGQRRRPTATSSVGPTSPLPEAASS